MKDTTNKDTMNAVDRMIGFLTMRYAFRYNTVMNCTEFRHTGSPKPTSSRSTHARAAASYLRCSARG